MPESKLNLMWEMYGKGNSLRTIAEAIGVSMECLLEYLGSQRLEEF